MHFHETYTLVNSTFGVFSTRLRRKGACHINTNFPGDPNADAIACRQRFANVPHRDGPFPVVIALHGYIEPEIYQTLDYTTHYADALASAGYLVLHPNLRSYPPSDDGDNLFRVGMAIDVLNLIAPVIDESGEPGLLQTADPEHIGLWGHSMGGGVSTRVLTVSQNVNAAVLYAAMTDDEQKNYETIYRWSNFQEGWRNWLSPVKLYKTFRRCISTRTLLRRLVSITGWRTSWCRCNGPCRIQSGSSSHQWPICAIRAKYKRYNHPVRFTTIFFDLDDTLYPASTGLWHAIKERMNLYMRDRMGFDPAEIPGLRERYYLKYGTTLRGLQANHEIDVQDFLAFVHDLPLRDFIQPNPALCEVIAALGTRNLVFTNANAAHARRVLKALELDACFENIVDVNAVAPYCKPMPESFQIALHMAGENDPGRCVMIDDLPRTTQAARQAGLFSILYGADDSHPDADATLTDWRNLPIILNGRVP